MASTEDDKPEGAMPEWVDMLKSGKIPRYMLSTITHGVVMMAMQKLPAVEKLKLVRQLAIKLWPNAADLADYPCDCTCDACTSSCMHRPGAKP
jgi:hypothetical protein